jgi:hypothetical protein
MGGSWCGVTGGGGYCVWEFKGNQPVKGFLGRIDVVVGRVQIPDKNWGIMSCLEDFEL